MNGIGKFNFGIKTYKYTLIAVVLGLVFIIAGGGDGKNSIFLFNGFALLIIGILGAGLIAYLQFKGKWKEGNSKGRKK